MQIVISDCEEQMYNIEQLKSLEQELLLAEEGDIWKFELENW